MEGSPFSQFWSRLPSPTRFYPNELALFFPFLGLAFPVFSEDRKVVQSPTGTLGIWTSTFRIPLKTRRRVRAIFPFGHQCFFHVQGSNFLSACEFVRVN